MLTSKSTSAYALVTDLFATIDDGRWTELARILTPDCVCERPGTQPLAGLAMIEHFYRHDRPIESGHHEIYAVVSDLGAAACWGRFTGRHKTGTAVDARFAETFIIRDDKIAVRTTYHYDG